SATPSFGQIAIFPVIRPDQNGFVTFVGDPFSQTFTCANCGTAPVTWRIDSGSLPSGILLDGTTGVMSGTATAATNLGFTMSAIQGGKVLVQRQYGITVFVHQLTWTTPATLPPATAGTPVTRTLQVSLISLWKQDASTLPAGVSVSMPTN